MVTLATLLKIAWKATRAEAERDQNNSGLDQRVAVEMISGQTHGFWIEMAGEADVAHDKNQNQGWH